MNASRRSQVPWFAVPRPRLIERLDSIPGRGICALIAPAGCGKSVLMSQWIATRTDSVAAWVELTRSSPDPVVFARQLVEAIAEAVPGSMERLGDLFAEGGGLPGETFVTQVVTELGEIDQTLALIFDDVERVGALDAAAETLDDLLEQLPGNTRAFVIARWDPPVAFHRWRVNGRLHELRAADLAFDVDEATALVNALTAIELDTDDGRMLQERTEGWAVGIQLAAVSIGNSQNPGRFVEGIAGTDTHIAEYLVEEMLGGLDTRVRDFLVSTSVLPWLSVDLCSHVLDSFSRDEIATILDLLNARGLYLLPVDEHESRVRHHRLFADLLLYELRRNDPSIERRLRRRATDWLLTEGYLTDAAEELVELGDADGLLGLVRAHGRRYYERNETATLARWLVEVRNSTPEPRAEVEIHLLAAEFACHQISAAIDTSRALRRRSDLTRSERAEAEALHALLGLHDLSPAETERAATKALDIARTLRPGDCSQVLGVGGEGMVELFAWFMRGQAAFYEGDLDRALEMFERALSTPESHYVAWRVYILGAMALVQAWRGHLTASESLATTTVALAKESLTPRHIALAYSQQAAALVALNRLDLQAARYHLHEAQPMVERSLRPPLIGMQRLLRAGTTAIERGAVAALEEMERAVRPAIQPRVIDLAWHSLHARLLIGVGRPSAARGVIASISPARLVPAARIDLALAMDDHRTAKAELGAWSQSPQDLGSLVSRHIREAAIRWRDGSRPSALRTLDRALSLASTEGLARPFLEVPAAVALLRSELPLQNTPLAQAVLAAADLTYRRDGSQSDLVEPLTERELEILRLLTSRMSNDDLASALFISVNTLKTHLRHIYVKLDARDRDDAIDRATILGLL